MVSTDRLKVTLDPRSWEVGFDDGFNGLPWGTTAKAIGNDKLAYASGFIEGHAARSKERGAFFGHLSEPDPYGGSKPDGHWPTPP